MKERYELIMTPAGGRRGRGRGRGREGGEERTTAEQRQRIRAWFVGRVPGDWFEGAPTVTVDDDEIFVTGSLAVPDLGSAASSDERATACAARIGGFRDETRDRRVRIAEEAQQAFGRHVSWGATCGEITQAFTTASVPVMTRLRISERRVLDTLIDAGIARSRSEALAWCVRLVGSNEDGWISELRGAFEHVEEVRSRGPGSVEGSA
jgi:hypothetical protein